MFRDYAWVNVDREHTESSADSQRELAAADRWQLQQARGTWDRFRSGEGRTVPREQIERIFTDALARREPTDLTR